MGWDLLFRGGRVVTPAGVVAADVAVTGGGIAEVAPGLDPAAATRVVDAAGLHVFPGAVDAHVHLGVAIAGEPSADDAEHGTLAALCGGVTAVGDFTVQEPGEGLLASIRRRRDASSPLWADLFLHANVTWPGPGVIHDIPAAVAQGIGSFKVFLAYPGMMLDPSTLENVWRAVDAAGALLMVHAEDQSLVAAATDGLALLGQTAAAEFFDSRPPAAEQRAVDLLGRLSRRLGLPAYVVHLSSRVGLEAALEARALGARLALETCPQYLLLDGDPVPPDPHLLACAPPLRSAGDRAALSSALAVGAVQVLATDHCPFTSAQKAAGAADFRRIPGGLPGVETLLPFAYHQALTGAWSLARAATAVASAPAAMMGLAGRKGLIEPGYDADLVLLDPAGATVVRAAALHSRTDYSPYEGMRWRGAIRAVYLRGRLAAESRGGRVEAIGAPEGRFLPARAARS